MIAKRCRACPQEHVIYLQATPEYVATRRETLSDFLFAALVWGMVAFAYVSVGLWVASRV